MSESGKVKENQIQKQHVRYRINEELLCSNRKCQCICLIFQHRLKFLEMLSPPPANATTAKAPVGTRKGFAECQLQRKERSLRSVNCYEKRTIQHKRK